MADLGQTGGRAIKWLEHFWWKDLLQARQWLALWKMWIAHNSSSHLEPWCLVSKISLMSTNVFYSWKLTFSCLEPLFFCIYFNLFFYFFTESQTDSPILGTGRRCSTLHGLSRAIYICQKATSLPGLRQSFLLQMFKSFYGSAPIWPRSAGQSVQPLRFTYERNLWPFQSRNLSNRNRK